MTNIYSKFSLSLLPKNMRFLRKKYKLSQEGLAVKLSLSRSQIASYEVGIVEPKPTIFMKITDFFNVHPVIFLTRDLAQYELERQAEYNITDEVERLISKLEEIKTNVDSFTSFYKYRMNVSENLPVEVKHFIEELQNRIDVLSNLVEINEDNIDEIIRGLNQK